MIVPMMWLAVSILGWFAALTFGLPLTITLLLNQRFRSALFSFMYTILVDKFLYEATIPMRRKAFLILRDNVNSRNRSVPLEILEIGIGTGSNLKYYPENCNLTVLDKNKNFEQYFEQRAKMYPHICYKRTLIQPAEKMSDIADSSMDVVVSIYVNCSVDDFHAVLNEVKRVLKPGGKYLFLDHVCFPKKDVGFYIQKFVGPLWTLYFNGCCVDRDIAVEIKGAGFSEVLCSENVSSYIRMYLMSHQIVGIATK